MRTSSESDGAALSISVSEFIPPVRAAAPVLSKAHSSLWSAGKAGAAVGNSKRGGVGSGNKGGRTSTSRCERRARSAKAGGASHVGVAVCAYGRTARRTR